MSKRKRRVPNSGVGMPAHLYLQEFGSQVWSAFGSLPCVVGSSLRTKKWRDVDVRLILTDEEYAALGVGHPHDMMMNAKWAALCMAFSALGTRITGLPIDFQIQQVTDANKRFPGPREPLAQMELRYRK